MQPLGLWVRRQMFSIADLLTYCTARAISHTVLLWLGWDAHCPSLCCGQLQCAFMGVGPSLFDLSMPLRKVGLAESIRAYWSLTVHIFLNSCLAHNTFVLARDGGKGVPSSPGKKLNLQYVTAIYLLHLNIIYSSYIKV